MKKCGYYPPASKKALLRAQRDMGDRSLRDPRSKPCGKPATFVAPRIDGEPELLYLCGPHAASNARRGYSSTRIEQEGSNDG